VGVTGLYQAGWSAGYVERRWRGGRCWDGEGALQGEVAGKVKGARGTRR